MDAPAYAPGPRTDGRTVRPERSRRALVAGSVGNFIEWYEFGVYGYFATVIAARFFTPEGGSEAEALVRTYASFALAFFFRPVGAALFGRLGDRVGRRPVLILVIVLMTVATTSIGVLPTYDTVGALAPWLLTLLRVCQGLSAGGEFGGAVSVMTEFAPPGRRGLYGSWQSFTVALGLLGGAGAAALLATLLSEAELHSWGWRLPFLLTLPMGLGALWLRLRLDETPSFRALQERSTGHGGAPCVAAGGAAAREAAAPGTAPGDGASREAAGPGPTPPETAPGAAAQPGTAGHETATRDSTQPAATPDDAAADDATPDDATPDQTAARETAPGKAAQPRAARHEPAAREAAAVEPAERASSGLESSGCEAAGRAVAERAAGRVEVVRAVLLGAGRVMGWAAAGYTFLVVLPSYLQNSLDATFQQALVATVLANLGFAATILPAGLLSDRIGRRPVMLAGALLVTVLAVPLLDLVQDPGASHAVKGCAVSAAGAVVGLMAGPGPAMLSEMFPTGVRYTGLGLSYALSNAVFSGCAGLVITKTVERTGNVDIPAYYAAATCAVSVLALLTLREPRAGRGSGPGAREG